MNLFGWGPSCEPRNFRVAVTSMQGDPGHPSDFNLSQNYPNPFNPSTTIRYGLANNSLVTLAVFNTLGQEVALLVSGEIKAGDHEVVFDASNLSSGVYIYRIHAGNFVSTKRMLVLK